MDIHQDISNWGHGKAQRKYLCQFGEMAKNKQFLSRLFLFIYILEFAFIAVVWAWTSRAHGYIDRYVCPFLAGHWYCRKYPQRMGKVGSITSVCVLLEGGSFSHVLLVQPNIVTLANTCQYIPFVTFGCDRVKTFLCSDRKLLILNSACS